MNNFFVVISGDYKEFKYLSSKEEAHFPHYSL